MKRFFLAIATVTLLISATIPNVKLPESDKEPLAKQTPEEYDSLLAKYQSENLQAAYENYLHEFIDIDTSEIISDNIPDSVYAKRLKMIPSVIQLPFNQVIKQYLRLYAVKKKDQMGRMLGLAQYYFPIIEEQLYLNDLPVELRMLPIIESGLHTGAVSRVGASGLWQFMFTTGRSYGLEINSFVDQRFDVQLSTKAACKFLKDLYSIYNDWTLAIAAYNCGPGNVNKALKRAPGAKTYWDIYEYLPKETRGYVPAFIAATYAYTYHNAHDIKLIQAPIPMATDTITINRLMHFEQVSSTIGIPIEILRALNPQYKRDIIPVDNKQYVLTIPSWDVTKFIEKEQEIYAKDSLYLKTFLEPDNFKKELNRPTSASGGSGTVYKVKSGDNLGAIARKHKTTVSALKKANGLKSDRINPGQRLKIR